MRAIVKGKRDVLCPKAECRSFLQIVKLRGNLKKNHFIPGKGQVTLLIHLIELDNLGKYKTMASSMIVIWDFLVLQKHDTGL